MRNQTEIAFEVHQLLMKAESKLEIEDILTRCRKEKQDNGADYKLHRHLDDVLWYDMPSFEGMKHLALRIARQYY